jgi:hypothetical protein
MFRDTVGEQYLISTNKAVVASATDVDTGTDKIAKVAHGFENGDLLLYTAGTAAITGLTTATYYYVVNKATDDFQVSATSGGSAINLTGTGTGSQTFTPSVEIKVRVHGATADVAESPLRTNADGEIVAGTFAAVAVGARVIFRGENFKGRSTNIAQITTA